MAAQFYYQPRGGSSEAGPNGYAELVGIVVGAADEAEASVAADFELPLVYNGFPRQPLRITEDEAGIFHVTAPYRLVAEQPYPPVTVENDYWLYSLDSGEATVHVNHAFDGDEGAYTAIGEATPAFLSGAINVTPDGIQGVDVQTSDPVLIRRKVVPTDQVSWAWRKFVSAAGFRLNNAPWLAWETREVLYRKSTIVDRNNGETEITQEFKVGEFANVAPGPTFNSILKAPHDYFWTEFVERTATVGGVKKKTWVPVAIRVNRLYPDMSFGDLEPS